MGGIVVSFAEQLASINSTINGIVWGPLMLILIVGTGIYLSVRVGFIQFRRFGYAMKNTLGKCFEKHEVTDPGAVSPVQAVTTALAATVGTGNIVGVTGAIAAGGPGAVFWMELAALFGMVTKYSEVAMAIKFRERNDKGDWVGGPMYYVSKGLGANWKWLGVTFAVLGALCAFGIGNMTQIHSIASSVSGAAKVVSGGASNDMVIRWIAGISMAVIAALVYLGGIKRIGEVCERLVPVMAVIYIVSSLIVIFANIGNIGPVLKAIFIGAFNPSAVVGGAVGITITRAMTKGVARGVFSNEAGLGSAPIAHAAADTKGPVQQGLFGIFEVFADTTVICTMTALVILMSGTPIDYGKGAGVELTNAAFGSTFGAGASVVVAIGITLFAGSTILSWGLYGTRCAEFLFGTKVIKPYQVIFILVLIVGATAELNLVWDIADTLNALMAIPNLIALLGLSPLIIKLTKEYFQKVDTNTLEG